MTKRLLVSILCTMAVALTLAASASARSPAYEWYVPTDTGGLQVAFQHPRADNLADCLHMVDRFGAGTCSRVNANSQYSGGHRVFGNGQVWADVTASTYGYYDAERSAELCHIFRRLYKGYWHGNFACVAY